MGVFQQTISNEEIPLLPKAAFPGEIIVVDTEKGVARACEWLMGQSAIGFDTETRPAFKAGVTNKVALLQLSGEGKCFLFRLCKMKLDKPIIKVLENNAIQKIGAAVHDDIKGLQALRHFRPGGFLDLQGIVGDWGIQEKSVRKFSAIVMGVGISKAQRLSNWEAARLTPAQMSYAATDAWICLEVYKRLMAEPR